MYFYIFINIILGVLSILSIRIKSTICDKLSYLLVLLILVFRSGDVGGDLINYAQSFFRWRVISFEEIFQVKNSNIGFVLINWLIGQFTDNKNLFFAIISGTSFTFIYGCLKKWSKNISLSVLVFLSIGGYSWLLSGMRQVLAMGILMYAVTCLFENKAWKYFAFFGLAVSIHSTAIIGILYFLVVYGRDRKKFIVRNLILLLVCIAIVFKGMPYFVRIYKINDYSNIMIRGEGLGLLFLFIAIIVIYYHILRNKRYGEINLNLEFVTRSCWTGCSIQFLSYGFSLLTRLTNYFSMFFPIFISNILMEKKKDKMLVIILTIFGLTIFCGFNLRNDLSGIIPYKLIWQ